MIFSNDEIKAKAHEYIDTQLAKDINWMSTITDSWIYDAESWFINELGEIGPVLDENDEYIKDVKKQVSVFWKHALAYKDKKRIELYWEQDSKAALRGMIHQLENYRKATKELKKMIGHKNDNAKSALCLSEMKLEEYEQCLLSAHTWLCAGNIKKNGRRDKNKES